MECTWDKGERDRERKLTNISQWRQLHESELMQYIASSDSDDDDREDEDGENNNSNSNSEDESYADAGTQRTKGNRKVKKGER